MSDNEIQNTKPVSSIRPRRRNVTAAVSVLAVLGIGVGGYVVHNAGVITGQQQGREQMRSMLIDAAATASATAPVLDAGRRVGDACLTTVKVGGATWVLPDDRGGAMRRATAEERDALSEHAACGGVTIPN